MLKYVAVAGNMGSGKSSLVKYLCHRYPHIRPFYERNEENPYLADFYSDMNRWAFHSQVYFLSLKLETLRKLKEETRTVIQDRTIYEDAEIFAENLHRQGILTGRDYGAYRRIYETILEDLKPPDLLIYLKTSVRTAKKRVALRGRGFETAVDSNYLKGLNDLYKRWIERYKLSPILTIDADRLDFLNDMVDRIELLETIERHL